MVCAVREVDLSMRLAALPVGAARDVFIPLRSKMVISSFNIVVFPVPGPPVIMHKLFVSAACIARS